MAYFFIGIFMKITILYSNFKILGKEIPFYGLLMIFGFALAIIAAIPRAKKLGIPISEIIYSAIFTVIGALSGAKLLAILTSIQYIIPYLKNGGSILAIIQGGFVFYGGFIGGFLALFLYTKAYKEPFGKYIQMYAPSVPLGHLFGRIGCLFGGCCYGMPVSENFPFSVVYQFVDEGYWSMVSVVPEQTYLPIQLIEALSLIVVYVIAEYTFYKSDKKFLPTYIYLFSYGVLRFTLEFFRGDAERGFFLGLSTSQIISLLILSVSAYFLIKTLLKKKNEDNTNVQLEIPLSETTDKTE